MAILAAPLLLPFTCGCAPHARVRGGVASKLLALRSAGCAPRVPVGGGELYREAVATFDDPVKYYETHLSGYIGDFSAGNRESVDLVHRPDLGATKGCVELAYNMGGDAPADGLGGMWLSLRGPPAARHVVLDLSAWDSLSFKVRGRATLVDEPVARRPGCTLRVEVKDGRRSFGHTAFRYVRIEPAEVWSTVTLSADVADGGSWRFHARPPDPRRAKELRFVIEERLNQPRGRLLLDDVELVRKARPGDRGPQDDDAFLDQVERAAFRFFWDYAHPTLGICPGAMFTYTFASVWLPREELDRPDLHPTQPVNWWQNTRRAARANYAYCRAHPELYGKHGWGLTACEGRLGTMTLYKAYGAPPVFGIRRSGDYYQLDVPQPIWHRRPGKKPLWVTDNSVVAAYGAASAISFLPAEALRALRHYRERTGLWRSADCGFGDAYAESTGYTNHAVFAIDAGPMLIAIDNYRARRKGERGTVWRSFAANPEIRHALDAIYGARDRSGP